jgi:hypothetical protein
MKYLFILLFLLPSILIAQDGYYAFVPYVNYDTTQSWTIGSAFEKISENRNIATYLIDLEASPQSNIHLQTNYKTHIYSNWKLYFDLDFSNFYDSYYGLGMDTQVQNLRKIKQTSTDSKINFLFENSHYFSFGPYLQYQKRLEDPSFQFDKTRFFTDERQYSLGLAFLYDSRDSKFNPHSGDKLELFLSTPGSFAQSKIDLRKYFSIFNSVLATRFSAGETFRGSASYSFKYKLGGADLLRGYQTNRFIGNHFSVLQIEERVNVYKELIIATASIEAGTVSSSITDKTRISKGIGLRIAMPPDWTNLLSINWGFGNDQNNFSMDFNENF